MLEIRIALTSMVIMIGLFSGPIVVYHLAEHNGVTKEEASLAGLHMAALEGLGLLSLFILGIMLLIVSSVFEEKGFRFIKNLGSQFMMNDLNYIGYKKELYTSKEVDKNSFPYKQQVLIPDKSDKKLLPRWLAALSYRGNIFIFNQLKNEVRNVPCRNEAQYEGRILFNEFGLARYVDANLRREVYWAIKAERKFLKVYPKKNWVYPPATYFFGLNQYDDSVYPKVSQFLESNYNAYDAERLKKFDVDEVKEFVDSQIPVSWLEKMGM